jgi:ABC-type multidrug transport system fused ATPase/permease subunit
MAAYVLPIASPVTHALPPAPWRQRGSLIRFLWTILLSAAAFYSAFLIPLLFAFSSRSFVLDIIVDILFLTHFVLHSLIFIPATDTPIVAPKRILVHFLTNLRLDAFACIPWILLGVSLIGIVRVRFVYGLLDEIVNFRKMRSTTFLHLSKAITTMLTVTHLLGCFLLFLACPWGKCAAISWISGSTWVISSSERYLRAVYFAISTLFTVGYGDIVPVTRTEMFLICIIVMFVSTWIFAWIIATTSSLMQTLDVATLRHKQDCERIAQACDAHRIPLRIRDALHTVMTVNFERYGNLSPSKIVSTLPTALQNIVLHEVGHTHVAKVVLCWVPTFVLYSFSFADDPV